jgi:outer membrane biogenesis lipoprotein LolB
MNKKAMLRILLSLLVLFLFSGCMESMVKPEAKTDTGEEMESAPIQWTPGPGGCGRFRMEGRREQ